MRRLCTTLGTLAAGALLAVGLTGSAYAATGTFDFTTSEGTEEAIQNPQDNICYGVDISGRTVNGTNRDAIVFSGERCRGSHVVLTPGQEDSQLRGQSVRFIR
ncbi:hypothetical protein [Kitasatospora sp. NPDC088779]|uniref:hypothetical protein n=1 Tax=unclassified Kitasatospora TaxID=2633591 RepID=UPI00344A09FE